MKIIQRGEHRKDCSAMKYYREGTWDTPWAGYVHNTFRGDITGRRNVGNTQWIVVRCNCVKCKALLLINLDIVCEEAQHILEIGGAL